MSNPETSLSLKYTLTSLMASKGLKERDIVNATGLPQTTISNILSGKSKNPRPDTLKLLSELFGLTVDQFLGYEELGGKTSTKDLLNKIKKTIQPLAIPIIEWCNVKNWVLNKKSNKVEKSENRIWLANNVCKSPKSFALKAKPSMQLHFFYAPSTLLVDPEGLIKDGAIILIFLDKLQEEPSLRFIKIDGKEKILQSLEKDRPSIVLSAEHFIAGTVPEIRLNQENIC